VIGRQDDQFIDLRDVRSTLELHSFTGQPYYLGAFLLGAYQESSATCTTCSATPTRSTCAWMKAARSCSMASSRGTRCARSWPTCSTTGDELLNQLRKDVNGRAHQHDYRARIAAIAAVLRDWIGRVHLPGRALTDAMAPIYVALPFVSDMEQIPRPNSGNA